MSDTELVSREQRKSTSSGDPLLIFMLPSLGHDGPSGEENNPRPWVGELPKGAVLNWFSFAVDRNGVYKSLDSMVWPTVETFVALPSFEEKEQELSSIVCTVGDDVTGHAVFPFLWLGTEMHLRQRTGPSVLIPAWLAAEPAFLDMMYLALVAETVRGSDRLRSELYEVLVLYFPASLGRLRSLGEKRLLEVVFGLNRSKLRALVLWCTLRTLSAMSYYADHTASSRWTEQILPGVQAAVEREILQGFHVKQWPEKHISAQVSGV
ncbi:hypothetical protein GQ602_002944 [Ophiocordyceps camponoti-floridani]|uniref:Uncharacterized protein n=1 Tax=Ophiocordyceps camponoti-floridani TaxID=2030778 RepID=A0A8H4Q771_9HYPO|nr:hypothetical protein GQ602_002944 [Ophiocordyceps camponoti-floridani]